MQYSTGLRLPFSDANVARRMAKHAGTVDPMAIRTLEMSPQSTVLSAPVPTEDVFDYGHGMRGTPIRMHVERVHGKLPFGLGDGYVLHMEWQLPSDGSSSGHMALSVVNTGRAARRAYRTLDARLAARFAHSD